jgi:hypothetical protein
VGWGNGRATFTLRTNLTEVNRHGPICVPAARLLRSGSDVCDAGPVIVAHQGGWDELLFVLLPIVLFAGLLAVANRRASREQADRDRDDPSDSG